MAAPIIPASGHNCDCTIGQIRAAGSNARRRTSAAAGPKQQFAGSHDAAADNDHDSRFNRLIRFAQAMPRNRPVSRKRPERASCRRMNGRIVDRLQRMNVVPFRAREPSRSVPGAETRVSRQPMDPQAHGRPSGSMLT